MVVTIISSISAVAHYHTLENFNFNLKLENCIEDGMDSSYCTEINAIDYNNINDFFTTHLKIAILLPTFFFGGTWLFKYLFPKKN